MAVLTTQQIQEIRQAYAREIATTGVAHTKATLAAAIQAIEDTLTGAAAQAAISSAIDAAIAPATMTNALKRALSKQVYVSLGKRFS